MTFYDSEWAEFVGHYGEAEITISGPVDLVTSLADDLADDVTEGAEVYYDPGEGHVHIWKTGMLRNPDGTWQWR